MPQTSQNYTTQGLLDFYDRVKPVLAECLTKPIWTAKETAMLCAGYVPQCDPKYEKSPAFSEPESIHKGMFLDPQEYVPPNLKMYYVYLTQLVDTEPAPLRDMVQLLRPLGVSGSRFNDRGEPQKHVEVRAALHMEALQRLQWLFIIRSAIDLPVLPLVPFALLDKISSRTNNQRLSEVSNGQVQPKTISARIEVDSGDGPVIEVGKATAKALQRKLRERQPEPKEPEERGYYTSEELARITNLLPETLNKYARDGKFVEGFTPYKRQGGKFWQWRDNLQQAAYEASIGEEKSSRRIK